MMKQILSNINGILKNKLNESNHRNQLMQIRMNEQQQLQYEAFIKNVIYKLTTDLYVVFKHKTYPRLKPFQFPENMRLKEYVTKDGYFNVTFYISKDECEPISETVLLKIREQMNQNIEASRFRLFNELGEAEFLEKFPFLYYGVYVTSLKEANIYEVKLTVQTTLLPENFY